MNLQKRAYRRLPALIALLVFATVAMGAIALHFVQNRLIAASGESLALVAADIADKLDRLLLEQYANTQIMAQTPALQGSDPAVKTRLLNLFKAPYGYPTWISVTDARGRVIADTYPDSVGQDLSEQIWFRFVRDHGGVYVQDAGPDQALGGVLAVTFTAPIKSPAGKFLGAVTSHVRVSDLEQIFKDAVRSFDVPYGKAGRIEYQFLARDGEVIADSILRQESHVNLKLMGLPSALFIGSAQPGYVEEMHVRRHVPVVTGYAQAEQHGNFAGLHWGVLVRMDRQDILAPINRVLRILAAGGAVILVPILGLLVWSSGRLRREWTLAQEESARAAVSEAQFRGLLEFAPDAFVIVDREGRIVLVNAQAEKLFGYAREELIGQSVEMLMPEGFRSQHVGHRAQYAADPRPRSMGACLDLRARRKDGSEVSVDIGLGSLMAGDEMLMMAAIRDTTERKKAESERNLLHKRLQGSHDQLRVLARRVLEVQEEERRLLARELHDEIGQQMTAIKLNLQLLQTSTDPARAAVRFQDSIGIVDHLLTLVRARSLDLRPPLLDELGLGPALESFVRVQARRAGLALDLDIEPNAPRLPAPLEIAAFRVVQESLTNVIRHAQATRIAIAMQHTRESVTLTVRDNGRGFDMQAMEVRAQAGEHAGLMGLRERVSLFNGDFAIESTPGRGTEIRVTFPLEPAP